MFMLRPHISTYSNNVLASSTNAFASYCGQNLIAEVVQQTRLDNRCRLCWVDGDCFDNGRDSRRSQIPPEFAEESLLKGDAKVTQATRTAEAQLCQPQSLVRNQLAVLSVNNRKCPKQGPIKSGAI